MTWSLSYRNDFSVRTLTITLPSSGRLEVQMHTHFIDDSGRADPDLCENILKYCSKADGVHGQCYYELAIQNKDCELCKRIKDQQIRKMCELDACK